MVEIPYLCKKNTTMKSLQLTLFFVVSFFCIAELSAASGIQSTHFEYENNPAVLVYEHQGILVYAKEYTLENQPYFTLEFVNNTAEDVRFLWSIEVDGNAAPINVDGTIQAYMTIPSGESKMFGQSNSADPLLESRQNDLKSSMKINIEIQ